MALESCSCWALSGGRGTATGRAKRYCSSEAWAAAYGNETGGRKSCGAFSSLNSYVETGTNCDINRSASNAGQAKAPSVPAVAKAISAEGKLARGYCAATSGAAGPTRVVRATSYAVSLSAMGP